MEWQLSAILLIGGMKELSSTARKMGKTPDLGTAQRRNASGSRFQPRAASREEFLCPSNELEKNEKRSSMFADRDTLKMIKKMAAYLMAAARGRTRVPPRDAVASEHEVLVKTGVDSV